MKKVYFVVGMLLTCILCATPSWSDDARQVAFLKATQNFVEHHKLPDGEAIDNDSIVDDFEINEIAVADINGDGKPKLLIKVKSTSNTEMTEYVCGFDEKSHKITVEYIGYPDLEYFDNGCIKEYLRRRRGFEDYYSLITYNTKEKKYGVEEKVVVVWNKRKNPVSPDEEKPFPDKIDVTGDGLVYFIEDKTFKLVKNADEPVDTPIYNEWIKKYIDGAKKIDIEWFPASSKGIKMLKAKLEGLPVTYPSFSADTIYDKMLKAAQDYVAKNILPANNNSDNEDIGDISKNMLAICDINGDGKPELLIKNIKENNEYVYGFNEKIEKIQEKYSGPMDFEYFNNGCIKHKSYGEDDESIERKKFSPYQFAIYNKKQDIFEIKGNVDIWNKDALPTNPEYENKPFPTDIDVTGDGFVYFIFDDDFEDAWWDNKAVDTPVYEAWVKKYIGDAKPVQVQWVPATADGIKALEAKRQK